MKNLKKVLAMVLAFACTFSMFAGAKVFEDVPAGSDYSEAITMLSDLGIIQGKDDGKYHPEDTITRAEACAMIARLMTGDPNVSQYVGAQSFTDVAKGSWKDSAIGYCYINGIVIGVGNNKFEPDRAITDAEFITMVVRAMGYETADMKQNYPFSYMSNAQAIGLLDGTNMVASTDALRGEDAQVIYNALFTDYARGAKLVNTTHGTSVETYPTLAESVWGLERAAVGTWNKKDDEDATLSNCKAHTWVVLGADPTADGRIIAYPIDDDTTDIYTDGKGSTYSFKYDGDASAVAGYQVELWGEGNHGEPTWESKNDKYVWSEDWTIKAIKTVKGQKAYDYNASMADSKSENGEIVLGEETLDLDSVAANAKLYEQVYAVDQYVAKQYNGEKLNGKDDDKKVEAALNVRDGAQYKLMDWDSDGDIDWVVADTANYYKVEAVNSTRLTVSAMKAGNEETSTDSDSKTWKLNDLTEIDKVKYDFKTEEDLEEGDIIEVTYSVAYDKGEKDEVVTATITKVEADTAELDKVSTKDTLELTFDGEVKKIAEANVWGDVVVPANPAKYEQFDDEELGTQFALWTNRNGFIVYSDYATDTSNYLMVLDTADGSDKTGDRKLAKADVLFADNSVKKDVEFASDLTIDDKSNGNTGYNKSNRHWKEELVVGNVYKYWQNEDGVITKMESMFSADAERENDYTYDESADRLKEGGTFVASLEEADVIFAVTGNYIDAKNGNLYVDDSNVMAVKQSDIPEIVSKDEKDTNDTKAQQMTKTEKTWLNTAGASDDAYIAEVDKNGEASAAILGVENFNKFNAASTTVGLVTSVSYDKNDVVEIEVAYKGEVTTVKSAEKVDFEDIVKQYDGAKDNDLTTKKAAKMLKDNAAYAEITTNADGQLTAVTFMNVGGNKATGHYYEVSRRIITNVKSGNVAYGDGNYYYYNNKNLYSVGRLPVDDVDLADTVYYYSIDGRPTTSDDKYDNVMMAVANGFDGTPDIKAESDSNLINSYVNDKFDDADTYQVADLVTKIDGDIVAAYAFEDSLGEADKTASIVGDLKVQAGKSGSIDVKAAAGQSITLTGASVKGNVAGIQASVSDADTIKVDVARTVPAGKYTVEYTYTIGGTTYNGSFELTVTKADAQTVGSVAQGDVAATGKAVNVTVEDTKGGAVEGLTAADFTVKLGGQILKNTADMTAYTVEDLGNGEYQIALQNTDLTFKGNTLTVEVGGKTVDFGTISENAVPSKMEVADSEELAAALASADVKEITLTDDVAAPAGLSVTNENVTIDGQGKTINVGTTARGGEPQFVIAADGVTLKNVTVVSDTDYAIQVYTVTDVTLENVTANGGKGSILVNGATVTMKDVEVVNDNWGGIEVSMGKDVNTTPSLTVNGLTYTVKDGTPVIWVDKAGNGSSLDESVVTGVNGILTHASYTEDGKNQIWFTPAK